MKPIGLKSVNQSLHRKNEELKHDIESLETEISNLKLMSKGEPHLESEIELRVKKLAEYKTELGLIE
jgi:predicted RNase H-like nuclease (RuvC/YqgF family)